MSLLCGCTDAVYMRNASGETVKCGSVYTSLAGDFESMGIAARESQCIQDYKDQGFSLLSPDSWRFLQKIRCD